MTPKSISRTRTIEWLSACESHDYEILGPQASASHGTLADGRVDLRAAKSVDSSEGVIVCSLTVFEEWVEGDDPLDDPRLQAQGCHIQHLRWHLQVGSASGAVGAERLDVTDAIDDLHPRVHRHPLGWGNEVRHEAEFPPPLAWLTTVEALIELYLHTTIDQADQAY